MVSLRHPRLLTAAAAGLLSACSAPAPADAAKPAAPGAAAAAPSAGGVSRLSSGRPPQNQCRAEAAQSLVGQAFGPGSLAQALQAAGADEARALPPGTIVTREYKLGRLNLDLDAAGRIVRVTCG